MPLFRTYQNATQCPFLLPLAASVVLLYLRLYDLSVRVRKRVEQNLFLTHVHTLNTSRVNVGALREAVNLVDSLCLCAHFVYTLYMVRARYTPQQSNS